MARSADDSYRCRSCRRQSLLRPLERAHGPERFRILLRRGREHGAGVALLDLVTAQQRRDRDQVEAWLAECIVTKRKVEDCHERQILAICRGDQLALGTSMMVGTVVAVGIFIARIYILEAVWPS